MVGQRVANGHTHPHSATPVLTYYRGCDQGRHTLFLVDDPAWVGELKSAGRRSVYLHLYGRAAGI